MPTKYQGNKDEVRALNAFITLMRSAAAVSARVNTHLKDFDVSVAQFAVLEALLHGGAMQQCDLARKLLVTGGNVTQLVDGLEKREFVTRSRCSEDRRVVWVELTALGEEKIRGIMPGHVERIVEVFSVLEVAEQEELRKICRTVGRGKERVSKKENKNG